MKSVFKSENSRLILQDHYLKIINESGLNLKSEFVTTTFGKTHVLRAGQDDKPPLVLLHGSCSNAAMWLGDMRNLETRYSIYAIDMPGEPGLSTDSRLNFKEKAFVAWLDQVIGKLNLQDITLVGNSLGGCVSLHYTLVHQSKIKNLILIAASGIVAPKLSFICSSILSALQGEKGMLRLNRKIFGKKDLPKEIIETTTLIMKHFNPMTDPLPIVSEEEIKTLSLPIHFIAGQKDITLNLKAVINKLSLNPNNHIEILEGQPHVLYNILDKILE